MASTAQVPSASIPWVDRDGKPTQAFLNFALDLASGKISLSSASDDTVAAKAGVAVQQLYQSAGSVRVRQK